MSGSGAAQGDALEQVIREHEARVAEDLASIQVVREQCESYGHEMSFHARRVEEASAGEDLSNYFVQRRLGARHELGLFVDQWVREQVEMLGEVEREVRSRAEEELDRLRREKASVSWG